MKSCGLFFLLLTLLHPAAASVLTSFEEDSLSPRIFRDIPAGAPATIVFDAVNDELDLNATGNTDMWTTRNGAPIAWTAIPEGLVNGRTWTVETEVRLNNTVQDGQVAGLTFYGGPDGARPDISFGLDNWDPANRAVRLHGLGDGDPNAFAATTAKSVILRVDITENGAADVYNFFFKTSAAGSWIRIGGAAVNYTTSFPNTRVGLTYKTGGARAGASFTYFNVYDPTTLPPVLTAHPVNAQAVEGGVTSFSIGVTGATSYQWRRNGVPVPVGGIGAVYQIDPIPPGEDGAVYDCVYANALGSGTSNPATLQVTLPPVGSDYYTSAVQAEPSLLAWFPVDGSESPALTNLLQPIYSGAGSGDAVPGSIPERTVGTKSIALNGNGWVNLAKDPAWDFTDGNGTVEMFAYQTGSPGYISNLFGVRSDLSGSIRYALQVESAGTRVRLTNGIALVSWTLPSTAVGRLIHLAVVMNAGKVTLYHNGAALSTQNFVPGSNFGLPAVWGAAGSGPAESFPGNLDNLAIYAEPLPASAVALHYQAWLNRTAGEAPQIASPTADQQVDEGQAASFTATLTDATGASYRWLKNGVDIPGAVAATYALPTATLADDGAEFRCVIYNAYGGTATRPALLKVRNLQPAQLLTVTSSLTTSQGTEILLTFSEEPRLTLANLPLGIVDGRINRMIPGPVPGTVTLWVSGLVPGQPYTLSAREVPFLSGKTLASVDLPFTAGPLPVPAPVELVRPGAEAIGPATRRGPFIFSEIHYHPAGRPDLKNTEFIEIYNSQSWAEDLGGFRITGEVNFTFPAGTTIAPAGRLVVAAVPADVMSVYAITGVLGPWSGSLNNSGGQVRLRDYSNAVVFTVDYDGGMPWPSAADGAGPSLVLARPSLGMESPQAWDMSFQNGGSPGAAEPTSADPYRTVLLNEAAAARSSGDFIELYNYSTEAVDLSGCALSDDRDLAKYVFPDQTSIPPGAWMAVDSSTLDFSLKAGGDTVFFRAPAVSGSPGRVLDALRFGPQRGGTSIGRYPDGASTFSTLGAETPGSENAAPAVREAVISEIHYHPPHGTTQPPFVEITNPTSAPLDLSGWRLRGGISYDFPAGTLAAPGGSVAVTAFSGSLNRSSGERLRLEKPIPNLNGLTEETLYPVIDEVTYGTGGRWGKWSDGGGSSLELKDLREDGRPPGSWADSTASTRGGWVTIEATGRIDNHSGAAINRLHVLLLGAGECLLDDVEVIPENGGNLVRNSGFQLGATGWLMQGTHDASSIEISAGGNFSLKVRAVERGNLAGNLLTVPLSSTLSENTNVTLRARVKWLSGHPEILLRLHGGGMEATGSILPPGVTFGTPGLANSRAAANAGPVITEVTHRPILPAGTKTATIYARISDVDGVHLPQVRYRADPSSVIKTQPMSYRGAGLYSAELPAQIGGTLIAYHIVTGDPLGARSTFPAEAPARECLIRWGDPTPNGTLGAYRLWMTAATRNLWTNRIKNSNTPLDITFVYGNSRVIYNASAQYSGSPFHTPAFSGPTGNSCDYDCNVPPDDRFLGETDFILAGPGTFGDDLSFIREQTMWWMARKLKLPSLHRRFCRVLINGVTRQTVFEDSQQPGGEWIDEYWPDDNNGNLHKAQDWIEYGNDGGSFETNLRALFTKATTTQGAHKTAAYRYQWAPRSVSGSSNDWAALTQLVDAHQTGTSATDPAYFAAMDPLVDQDCWARALTIQRIAGNWDTWGWLYGKNMYIYKPQNGPWAMTAWDIDFSLGLTGSGADADLFAETQDPLCVKFRSQPDFRRAYWRAFRDAVDGPMLAATANARIDAMTAGLRANGISADVSQVGAVKSYLSSRRSFIIGQLNTVYRNTTFASTAGSAITDDDGSLKLTGTAPPGVQSIRINGVIQAPVWTSETAWSLPLKLYAAANQLTVEALNSSGTVISSFPVSVTITGPPGIPPVIISEWMADNTSSGGITDPADGKSQDWFELHNTGSTPVPLDGFFVSDDPATPFKYRIPANTTLAPGQYFMVWADDEIHQNTDPAQDLHVPFKLSASGESLLLSTPDGRLVDQVSFGPQTPDLSEGRYQDSAAKTLTLPTPGAPNALTLITGLTTTPGQVSLSVQTTPGLSYLLESSASGTTWTPEGSWVQANGSLLVLEASLGNSPRHFFRVRVRGRQ